jgi:hypothetical protein
MLVHFGIYSVGLQLDQLFGFQLSNQNGFWWSDVIWPHLSSSSSQIGNHKAAPFASCAVLLGLSWSQIHLYPFWAFEILSCVLISISNFG